MPSTHFVLFCFFGSQRRLLPLLCALKAVKKTRLNGAISTVQLYWCRLKGSAVLHCTLSHRWLTKLNKHKKNYHMKKTILIIGEFQEIALALRLRYTLEHRHYCTCALLAELRKLAEARYFKKIARSVAWRPSVNLASTSLCEISECRRRGHNSRWPPFRMRPLRDRASHGAYDISLLREV